MNEKELLKFDLQLFAEGDDDGADVEAQPQTEEPEPSRAVDEPDEVKFEKEALVIDENGRVKYLTGKEAEDYLASQDEESDDEDDDEESPEEQPEKDSSNKEDTFVIKVNGEEQEVTLEELKRGYMRQSDYTRKTQALKQEPETSQEKEVPQNTLQPNVDFPNIDKVNLSDPKAVNEYKTNLAVDRALKVLGTDNFIETDPAHMAAFMTEVSKIDQTMYEVQAKDMRVRNFTNQKMAEEPLFKEIWAYADELMPDMTVARKARIDKAFASGDVTVLNEEFGKFRTEYYEKHVVPKKEKPKTQIVAKSGIKEPLSQETKKRPLNPRDLQKMTPNERTTWLLKASGDIQ